MFVRFTRFDVTQPEANPSVYINPDRVAGFWAHVRVINKGQDGIPMPERPRITVTWVDFGSSSNGDDCGIYVKESLDEVKALIKEAWLSHMIQQNKLAKEAERWS